MRTWRGLPNTMGLVLADPAAGEKEEALTPESRAE